MANAYKSAQDYGILTTGDMTAALNAFFALTAYSGIIFDFPPGSTVTITGTVNAGGKVVQFLAGTNLTGGGTLNNAQISAGYTQKCFDTSINLTNCATTSDRFSAQWYGAVSSSTIDSQPALQKSSDTMILNGAMTRDLYLPPGNYRINSPWILHAWNGTNYGQWSLNVIGDNNIENSTLFGTARIMPSFNDTFAIGVQRGYAGSITGISIEGTFTTALSFDQLVTSNWAAVSTARDTRYSPNCGIVIDPFTNGQAVPGSDTYPGLTSWYRGTSSNGGTTGFTIENCNIQGFTVCICNTPNGATQQGEDCVIDSCRLNFAKVAIAYCQTQSDNCFVNGVRSWSSTFTIVDCLTYGDKQGTVAHISRLNIVGANMIFNISSNKSFLIDKIYAEAFYSVGYMYAGATGAVVEGSTFHFAISNLQPAVHFQFSNIEVRDSTLRYYDDQFNKRIRVYGGRAKFVNCFFDQPPYYSSYQSGAQGSTILYENCSCNGRILGMRNDMYNLGTAQITAIAYGNFKLQNSFGLDSLDQSPNSTTTTVTYEYNCSSFNRVQGGFASAVAITPDSNRQCTITSANSLKAQVNDILIENITRLVVGRISAISGTIITISEIPMNITTGMFTSVLLHLVYYATIQNPIVGDITSGSPLISNVSPVIVYGYINNLAAGFRFDNVCFPKGTYIVSYDNTTKVLTMSQNATKTATRQNFINGNPSVEVRCMLPPSAAALNSYGTPFPGGTKWTEVVSSFSASTTAPTTWIFNKGGYLNATTLGLAAAYQADFNIQPTMRINAGVIQYFDTYTNTWINV